MEIVHMVNYQTDIRVRYAETDRMGYVYYGNFAVFFEVARVETLRSVGITYKSLEDDGILLPVKEYSICYHKPAFYDDMLRIETIIPTAPTAKIRFEYKTFRGGELLNTAITELVFVDKLSGRPMRCPSHVLKAMHPFFN